MENISLVNYVGFPEIPSDKPFLLTCQYRWMNNWYSQTTSYFDTVEYALFVARVNRAGWWRIQRRQDGIALIESKREGETNGD